LIHDGEARVNGERLLRSGRWVRIQPNYCPNTVVPVVVTIALAVGRARSPLSAGSI